MTTTYGTRDRSIARGRSTRKTCVHHWMVEPPGGPTSGARCRSCGAERSFFNNPDAVIEDGRTKSGFSHGAPGKRSETATARSSA